MALSIISKVDGVTIGPKLDMLNASSMSFIILVLLLWINNCFTQLFVEFNSMWQRSILQTTQSENWP